MRGPGQPHSAAQVESNKLKAQIGMIRSSHDVVTAMQKNGYLTDLSKGTIKHDAKELQSSALHDQNGVPLKLFVEKTLAPSIQSLRSSIALAHEVGLPSDDAKHDCDTMVSVCVKNLKKLSDNILAELAAVLPDHAACINLSQPTTLLCPFGEALYAFVYSNGNGSQIIPSAQRLASATALPCMHASFHVLSQAQVAVRLSG